MEWVIIAVTIVAIGLGGAIVRILLVRAVSAAGRQAVAAADEGIDRWSDAVDVRGRRTFARGLALDTDSATARALVARALDGMPEVEERPEGGWRIRRERELHVGLLDSPAGPAFAAIRFDLGDGVSPYYHGDYAGMLRRVRRAARRAGVAVTEVAVVHEPAEADGPFRVARATGVRP
jgi:hypothetical protein